MPTSVVPTSSNTPGATPPGEPELPPSSDQNEPSTGSSGGRSTSRWVDYETHELLEVISGMEDERRWARLREGILWAILFHILLISALTWIPRYVLRQPAVIDPFAAIKERKDLKYLDLPPDLVQKYQPKVAIKPVTPKPQIDRKTLDTLQREEAAKPKPPVPQPEPQLPPQQAKIDQPVLPQPQPAPVAPQPAAEAPRPSSVPAKAFQLGSQNPADQLNQAMRGAAQKGSYNAGQLPGNGGSGMAAHPGAGSGGVQVLSDTQGVDFSNWIIRWHRETERTWDPLIPDEVNPPILKAGIVVIRFKVLPNGQVTDMTLDGRSGDTGLDRAAWGAIRGSSYPPLPREFHGPFLELRAVFMYNQKQ
ncbi:cell envelope integrity protein TolA [Terracidiphilus gabretensis]|uniref:cell envelope integrity protein TolA n=1 Tax=Terracidiphilus gabretensis TaxID=1577687 RepID=UPI00071BA300|nr:cell envelope integrity protein TolA [Terracidiphilus gabretensis]